MDKEKYKKWLNHKMVLALRSKSSNVSIVDPELQTTEIAKKVSSIFGNTFYVYGSEVDENEFIKFVNSLGKVLKWETF